MITASQMANMARVVCYLPIRLIEALDREANSRGIARSDVMRRWLEPQAEFREMDSK